MTDRLIHTEQMMNQEWDHWLGDNEAPLGRVCPLCGAIVANTRIETHQAYHRAIYERLTRV